MDGLLDEVTHSEIWHSLYTPKQLGENGIVFLKM